MVKQALIATAAFFIVTAGNAQSLSGYSPCRCPGMTKAGKGTLYAAFGPHRTRFSRSTIRFKDTETGAYDFYLINAKAIDDRSFDVGKGIAAPQYSARIGYYLNNKTDIGIELSFEHAKYLLKTGQTVRLRGTIDRVSYNNDTALSPNFVVYEHTDGANYVMLNFLKRKNLLRSKSEKHWLSAVVKPGLGLVIPKTESRILGRHRNDRYHVSGYVLGLEGGLRYDFLKYIFAEATLKGAYAAYKDALLYGEGRASQHWWSLQYIAVLGVQVPVGRK